MSTKDIAARYATQIHRVVVGQDETVGLSFIALLLRGHLLIEGVPGTAKTLLARTVARLIGGTFKRIQFTPDLMPSDVVGTTVYEISTSSFRTRTGPVFANVVLADEINRAPAKTQSALLEAMEERQVTLEGDSLALPDPFLVLATQNPVEYEGTYPLPEAELDRFVFKAIVRYPSAEDERAILRAHDRGQPSARIGDIEPFAHGTLEECRAEVESVTVEDSVLDYVVRIAAESRRWRHSNPARCARRPRRSRPSPSRPRSSSTSSASSANRGGRRTCSSARARGRGCTCSAPRRPPRRSTAATTSLLTT